jgi:hypothetical protein
MPDIICKFSIPSGQVGGKLTGGFLKNDGSYWPAVAGPELSKDATLRLTVEHPDPQSAPERLNGIFTFSAAATAPNQAKGSPFVDNRGRVRCLTTASATKVVSNGKGIYTFEPISYKGGSPGHYELTFVAEDSNNGSPIQWSEDPEFDTGN